MPTARECMLSDIEALLSCPESTELREKLENIVREYRVQMKPEAQNFGQVSARAHLIDSVLSLWRKSEKEKRSAELQGLMGIYRMQVKQSRSRKAVVDPIVAVQAVVGQQPQNRAKPQPVPVAGGPRRNSKQRGECPKCHSPGVVLAPELSGEPFMACIYCGFQVFEKRKAGGKLEFDAASELFGRTFDDNDRA